MERWWHKVAVVTGASAGIGAACCKALLAQGMIVVGLARRKERMENEFKAQLPEDQKSRFHAFSCDVSQESSILSAFNGVADKFGGVDVLINNAGIAFQDTQIIAANNTEKLKATLDVNVLGVALCTREAFQSMKKRGVDGHVVIINSVLGHQILNAPNMSFNMYGPTKFALTAMTEVLRQEFLLNQTKIKVTSVSPGLVDTEAIERKHYPANVPILDPEDIADAVVYCLQTPPHVQIHELTIMPLGQSKKSQKGTTANL